MVKRVMQLPGSRVSVSFLMIMHDKLCCALSLASLDTAVRLPETRRVAGVFTEAGAEGDLSYASERPRLVSGAGL